MNKNIIYRPRFADGVEIPSYESGVASLDGANKGAYKATEMKPNKIKAGVKGFHFISGAERGKAQNAALR